jgi:glutamyl-tRNA synthetase
MAGTAVKGIDVMAPVIVRFAPSPTGYLHIGGARTAIFNWLYARKHSGKFILRIEDTDAERSTADSIQGILDGLSWLGMDWDEGPYFQSHFIGDHQRAAQQLVDGGHAYPCFCSKAELDLKRTAAKRQNTTYQYDGTCRGLSAAQVAEREAAQMPSVLRFKVPRGPGGIVFEDAVHGRIEKRFADIEDFILVRSDGQPLYVLSNAVDDIRDGITHVIRGQDGLANTPKQVLIYQGLKAPLPRFVHMSLTLDPKKAKISKRKHGEQVAIHYYRENGFLPWAVVNFLVLLGWSTSGSKEFFDRTELIQAFRLAGLGRTNAVFNIRADGGKHKTDPKLISMNAHYLRTMPMAALFPHIKAELQRADLWNPAFEASDREWFMEVMALIRERFTNLKDFVTYGRAYISDTVAMDATAAEQLLSPDPRTAAWLMVLADRLGSLAPFDAKTVEAALRAFLEEHQLKPGVLMGAVRTAVTGQRVGPDFMRVLMVLGQKRVAERLTLAANRCAAPH